MWQIPLLLCFTTIVTDGVGIGTLGLGGDEGPFLCVASVRRGVRRISLFSHYPLISTFIENPMAEGVGFEPTVPFDTAVFKTAGVNHFPTLPTRAIYWID